MAFGVGESGIVTQLESVVWRSGGAVWPEIRRFTQQRVGAYKPKVMIVVPAATARICLPSTVYVIGGAMMGAPV
jgi:hypothetical protein